MARTHGKDSSFSFNAVELNDELNQITMNVDVPETEITAFADAWQNFLAGKKNFTTEIQGFIDLAAAAGDVTFFDALGGGVKSTVFDPVGTGPAAGAPEYQCTASGLNGVLVASYRVSLPVGGAASYAVRLQHSGLTSRATS